MSRTVRGAGIRATRVSTTCGLVVSQMVAHRYIGQAANEALPGCLSSTRRQTMIDNLESYFAGAKLYGDDLNPEEIAGWFEDEREAYPELVKGERYAYTSHATDVRHGFRFLPPGRFANVLGVGSAYGDEFRPILPRIDFITVVEPSEAYVQKDIDGVPARYVKPNVDGSLTFPDDSFDLATCFAVLHHIPNVSKVVRELFRCLKPGGYLLIHEPTVSMGDWRKPRAGLTKRERGIPLRIFRRIVSSVGFKVISETRCCSSLLYKFCDLTKWPARNSMPFVVLDEILCRLLPRDPPYHPTELVKKVMVTSVFYGLQKPRKPQTP
jgi:SAM-dependent methyltransferase